MTPSNDELLVLCNILGKQVISTNELLLATMQSYESLAKMVYARLPDLSDSQRGQLYKLSSKGQTNIEHLEAQLKQFRETFEKISN